MVRDARQQTLLWKSQEIDNKTNTTETDIKERKSTTGHSNKKQSTIEDKLSSKLLTRVYIRANEPLEAKTCLVTNTQVTSGHDPPSSLPQLDESQGISLRRLTGSATTSLCVFVFRMLKQQPGMRI